MEISVEHAAGLFCLRVVSPIPVFLYFLCASVVKIHGMEGELNEADE